MDLVSCIIPTYKRSTMLKRAINSALRQSFNSIEVLVVDDNEQGSSESIQVQEIVKSFSNERVKYIGQEKHINGAVARNVGIEQSKGNYVAFLDDDDEWLPKKIEVQVNYLKSHENIDGVTCLYSIYKNNQEIRKCLPYSSEKLQFKVLSHEISMYTSTFLCRKSAIEKSGAFNPSLQRNQDLQMFTDFLDKSEIYPMTDYLVILHEDSNINRKNIKNTIDAKENFFQVEKNIINKYNNKQRHRIYSAHYFDIVVNALKLREYKIALKYLIKIGISFSAYYDAWIRFSRKHNGKIAAKHR